MDRTHYTAGVAFLLFALVFVAPFPKAWKKTERLFRARELRYPPDSTRRFFLRALFDGVAAPFKRVKMMDFFLMDQIVSQTTALRDWVLVMLLMLGASEAGAQRTNRAGVCSVQSRVCSVRSHVCSVRPANTRPLPCVV